MSDPYVDGAQLDAVLDTIIPARGELPGAGTLGLANAVMTDAKTSGHLDDIAKVLEALPADFAALDPSARESVLRDIERSAPQAFAMVVNMVYTAYYTQPKVLAGISERTGYNPGPPQPSGYTLAPFDDGLLAPVRDRGPLWRSDEV